MNQNILILMQKDFPRILFDTAVYKCDIGWDHLVYQTFQEIEKILSCTNEEPLSVIEISRSNAMLNIVLDLEDCSRKTCQKIGEIIVRSKIKSVHTCESCGDTENLVVPYYNGDYFRSLCSNCIPTIIEDNE